MERVRTVKSVWELKEAIDLGNVFIWDSEESLHRALEEVSRDLNPHAKMRIMGCKNVKFKEYVILKKFDTGEVIRFRELKDLGDKLLDINEMDFFSITSNDRNEMFELVQQLVNLGINTNVYLEEELERKKIVESFKENRKEFLEKIQRLKNSLEEKFKNLRASITDPQELERVEAVMGQLLESAEEMKKAVENAEEKPIKVAVFATKKAGKSMVVNSLLEEEYAPTSNEIPTPCLILYKPHHSRRIKLEHDGLEYWFDDAKSLKDYLRDVFEKVSLEGKKLSTMTIYYPKKGNVNYEIVDTPGPDLAGSEHDEVVKEAIEDADVAVFLIDYSKYAQKSEVELLKELKDYFHGKKLKYNSLIIVVNKIDLVFKDADLEKIRLRITDFAYEKFKTLGFESFAVIPISALLAFYMKKLRQIFGEEILSQKDVKNYLEEKYYEMEDSIPDTYVSEVQNIANSFSKTFKKKEVSFNELYSFTGFDIFEGYIRTLVNDKAELDRLWDCVTVFDSALTKIDNVTGQTEENLIEKRELMKKALGEFSEDLMKEIEPEKERFLKEFETIVKSFDEILKDAERHVEELLENFDRIEQEFYKMIDRKYMRILSDLRKVRKGKLKPEDLEERITWIDEEEEKEARERLKIDLESLRELFEEKNLNYWEKKLQDELVELAQRYQKKLEEFKEKAKKDYGVEINLRLPEIMLRVSFESFKKMMKRLEKPIFRPFEFEIDLENGIESGFFRKLGYLFGLNYLFDFDLYKVDPEIYEDIRSGRDEAKWKVQKEIEKFKKDMGDRLMKLMEETRKSFAKSVEENKEKCVSYLSVIDSSIRNLRDIASMDIETLNKVVDAFKAIREEVLGELGEFWKEKVIEREQNGGVKKK